MYGGNTMAAAGTGTATVGTLAATGPNAMWLAILVVTLISAGIVLRNLLPKREF